VVSAINILNKEGYDAYLVGGGVRDFLLDREPKDHDIATNAPPADLERLFPNAILDGIKFGVIKVPCQNEADKFLEISTFRKDLEYKDNRHPVGVVYSDIADDAFRRDFTVNALYLDVGKLSIIDLVGGEGDLKSKIIKTIGDPYVRFQEDAMRLFRAIRFAVKLEFDIEENTKKAIKKFAKLSSKISAERLVVELEWMFLENAPDKMFSMMMDFGLIKNIIPELGCLKKIKINHEVKTTLWDQTLAVLSYLSLVKKNKKNIELFWAALFHTLAGSRKVDSILSKLRFASKKIKKVKKIMEEQFAFQNVFNMREASLVRWLKQDEIVDIITLQESMANVSGGDFAPVDFCIKRIAELAHDKNVNVKTLSGSDLVNLGIRPGPVFSKILNNLEDLALEKKIQTREQAIEFVKSKYLKR